MIVTSKISVDLTRQNIGARVNAVQGDGNTRLVEITLLAGVAPWTPPDGVEAAIAYMQPGGTKGLYNKLADGTAAISISGNVATVILAPQMLAVSGTVQASIVFNDQLLNRLTTFPFEVSVTSNPAAGAQKVEDYIRLQWLEDKLEEYLAAIKASGAFDGAPGVPGLSPTVAVNDITGGHRITITDAEGDNTVDVMDGAQGVPGHTPEYGVDYGTPEQISGIAQQAAVLLKPELNQIKDDLSAEQTAREEADNALRVDLTANANADAVTKRSLDALWKLNQGISYQFETDDTVAYGKIVPSGAKAASVRQIGGKTVVLNQIIRTVNDSRTLNGVAFVNNEDGTITVKGTATSDTWGNINVNFPTKKNHKYLFRGIKGENANSWYSYINSGMTGSNVNVSKPIILKCLADLSSVAIIILVKNGITVDAKMKPQVFDITAMFGIGNEPSTVAEFESMFPDEYYPYDKGTLMSVQVNEIVNTGADGVETCTVSIPQAALDIDGYGMGINGTLYNHVDFQSKTFHKNVGVRAFVDGDAENVDVLTDGTTTVYPLAEEEIIDISDILTDIEPFEVESCSVMTFKNTNGDGYRIPVPNSVEYVVSLKEVGTA